MFLFRELSQAEQGLLPTTRLVPTASLHRVPIQLKHKEQIAAGKEKLGIVIMNTWQFACGSRLLSATTPIVTVLAQIVDKFVGKKIIVEIYPSNLPSLGVCWV
jgi:hypothetical protein